MSERMSRAELAEFASSIPFNRKLGICLKSIHADGITLECEVKPDLLNGSGTLHGGVTASLADVAVGVAIVGQLGRTRAAATVSLDIHYMRPIVAGKVWARARLLRVGSNLCCGRVEISDSTKKLVASAVATYMIIK